MDLQWMAWTWPTATFFAAIALILAGMTVWEIASPTVGRRGFLPMATTRGDRLFLGLLGSAYIHLAWLAVSEASLWIAFGISIVWTAVVMKVG